MAENYYGYGMYRTKEDMTRCIERISDPKSRFPSEHQCNGKRGFGDGGNYCKKHVAIFKRREEEKKKCVYCKDTGHEWKSIRSHCPLCKKPCADDKCAAKKEEQKSYGLNVTIRYNNKCPFEQKSEVRHNVTEIHYNFQPSVRPSVAFESDIHQTGGTVPIEWIAEFEAVQSTKVHESY